MAILDEYVQSGPSLQNAVDIFKGEWTSILPSDLGPLEAGHAGLFDDERVEWVIEQLGGVKDYSVLELGPLEAGHTYMLERAGAAAITAIESNTRAYLKCLIIKEIFQLNRSRFLCGDFMEYLRSNRERADLCFASGVLYHMHNPAELIALAAGITDKLYLWTHYFDRDVLSKNSVLSLRYPVLNRKPFQLPSKATGQEKAEHQGFRHTLYRQEYNEALEWNGFCGGSQPFSNWMTKEDILRCLQHFGLSDIRINHETPLHPHGPSFSVLALRPGGAT